MGHAYGEFGGSCELGDDARGLGFEGLRIICVSQGGELSVDLRGYVKLHGGGN